MGPVDFIAKDKPGLAEAIAKAGRVLQVVDGVAVADDPVAVQAIIDTYDPLPYLKARKQAALHAAADRIDLFKLIDAGEAQITNAQFTTFMVAVTNRYRALKGQIAGAADQAALSAIDIKAGWPGNP